VCEREVNKKRKAKIEIGRHIVGADGKGQGNWMKRRAGGNMKNERKPGRSIGRGCMGGVKLIGKTKERGGRGAGFCVIADICEENAKDDDERGKITWCW
jgi:hypothetical protein